MIDDPDFGFDNPKDARRVRLSKETGIDKIRAIVISGKIQNLYHSLFEVQNYFPKGSREYVAVYRARMELGVAEDTCLTIAGIRGN